MRMLFNSKNYQFLTGEHKNRRHCYMSVLLIFNIKPLADSRKKITFAGRILFTRCKCLILNLLLSRCVQSGCFKNKSKRVNY